MSTPAPDTVDVDADADRTAVHLTSEDRHRLLANDRRRRTLAVLDDLTPPLSLDELAAAVASRTDEQSGTRRVAVSLHHHHLPLLDDVGAVDYDPEANRVTACRATLSAEH
jgi:hypothetical protein